MEEIKLKIDGYTKFLLTLIAIALWGLLINFICSYQIAKAAPETINVNIEKVGGRSLPTGRIDGLLRDVIPVKITN